MCISKLAFALVAVIGASALSVTGPGIMVIPGGFEPGRQPDGNSVVFAGPDGLVVLDSGRHAAHTQKILDFAAQSKQPIAAVINTHWHLDHVSGNPRLRAAHPGLKVYASNAIDGAMRGFLAESKPQAASLLARKDVPDSVKAEIRADLASIDSGKALYPDVVVGAAQDVVLGGRRLHIGFEHAATRGDLWVYDPQTKFLAAGDLVTLPVPFFDTGCASGWSAALARLDQFDFERLLPGHGPGLTHAQFSSYRTAFDGFVACAATGLDKKRCADGWVRDAGALIAEADRPRIGGMLEYYVDLLRDKGKRAAMCD
jgi:glyoxylase-like metal-dependent hydrolase (beta-lactamase superfamily II)